jgi:ribosomal protein S18 acetylase RimI-like enzyme
MAVPDTGVRIRPIRPSDYRTVIAVIDDWWGGRHMADMLPRLFFEHFTDTSFAAERDGELAGFLIGFRSQSRPGEAYIHFVGIHPGERGHGLVRALLRRRAGGGLRPGPRGDFAGEPRLDRVPSADGLRHRAGPGRS